MIYPSLCVVLTLNALIREADELFVDEPEDLDRVKGALMPVKTMDDPVLVAATLAYRIARTQAFVEGNKRTALFVAHWVLDNNGIDGGRILPVNDSGVNRLLMQAAIGQNVEADMIKLFRSR